MTGQRDRGAALLLVILLVALLAVLVTEFQRETRVEIRAAENLADDLQSHALLRSGSDLTEQILAIYEKNRVADLASARRQVQGGELLWQFLFLGETVAIPVPSAVLTVETGLRGRLEDLYGRFPLGALVGEQPEPRRAVFRDYLGAVKEFLGSTDDNALSSTDTDSLADAVIARVEAAGSPGSLRRLADLAQAEGMTPALLRALSPFLDTRPAWKFDVNGRCIPLILTMHQGISVEEARQKADDLREDPVSDDAAIPSQIGTVRPEFANSLTTKSARFQATLEASVRGGTRRARAVFERKVDAAGVPQGKFGLVEWVEGWVEGLEEAPAAVAGADASQEGGAK
ncbi:MAG: general secretion pathway protein GspK [Deltaproteobacteria bacterium]|nr:general secretion pathway protein GspK [Deltaproteobacteria bacterium]